MIHLSPARLARVDGWFNRHGDATVFFARLIPLVRAFISLPAGVAKMPFWRFTWLTALGSLPWVVGFGLLGRAVGDNWEQWRDHLADPRLPGRRRDRRADRLRDPQAAAGRRIRRGRGDRARRRRRRLSEALEGRLPARRAVALGIVQGPAELLPVSSSAHIVLLPWLVGWDWEAIDPEVRKSFEVALHAGAAAALLIGQRRVIAEELRNFDAAPSAACWRLSFLPAAAVGYELERPIERPPGRAPGDRPRPARRRGGDVARRPPPAAARAAARSTAVDGLALGVAQAAALAPGVSRNGVTLAAARWRRFSRDQANLLSRTIALPIIVGATGAEGRPPRPAAAPPRSCAARWRSGSAPPSPRPSPPSA